MSGFSVEEKARFTTLIDDSDYGPNLKAALRLRFGLADGEIHVLEEVGRLTGIDPYAIRVVEARVYRKAMAAE